MTHEFRKLFEKAVTHKMHGEWELYDEAIAKLLTMMEQSE